MAEQLKHRSEVPVRETWDLTAIFATEADFENAFAFVKPRLKGSLRPTRAA